MKKITFLFTAILTIVSYSLTAQVAINTDVSEPDGSAMLDVKSTEKGMLIPRMTQTEIETISSPANGLTVFCTTDDTFYAFILASNVWKEIAYAAGRITPIAVGDEYGGGIVAYVLQTGDPGYVERETHGLIAAISDQSIGIQWYNGTYMVTGASGTALGTGSANTNVIMSAQGLQLTDYAAGVALVYNGGGYNDWFLPSKDELNKLYLNKEAIGGFANWYYWSSSEYSQSYAAGQSFINGNQTAGTKASTSRVRAVRAF